MFGSFILKNKISSSELVIVIYSVNGTVPQKTVDNNVVQMQSSVVAMNGLQLG